MNLHRYRALAQTLALSPDAAVKPPTSHAPPMPGSKVEAILQGRQFAASILVDGRPLSCYEPRNPAKEKSAKCFIASEAGKTFTVQLDSSNYLAKFKWTAEGERFVVVLCIDGIKVATCMRCVEDSEAKFVFEDVQTEVGVKCFQFSKITNEMIKPRAAPQDPSEKFGTIELVIYKAKDARRSRKGRVANEEDNSGDEEDVGNILPLPKLSPIKAGNSGYHRVVYVDKSNDDEEDVVCLSDSDSESASGCAGEWTYNYGTRLDTLTFCYRPAETLRSVFGVDVTAKAVEPPKGDLKAAPSKRPRRSTKDQISKSPDIAQAATSSTTNKSSRRRPPVMAQTAGSSHSKTAASNIASASHTPSSVPQKSRKTAHAAPPPKPPAATRPATRSGDAACDPPRNVAGTSQSQGGESPSSNTVSSSALKPRPIPKTTTVNAPVKSSRIQILFGTSAGPSSTLFGPREEDRADNHHRSPPSDTRRGNGHPVRKNSSDEDVGTSVPQAEEASGTDNRQNVTRALRQRRNPFISTSTEDVSTSQPQAPRESIFAVLRAAPRVPMSLPKPRLNDILKASSSAVARDTVVGVAASNSQPQGHPEPCTPSEAASSSSALRDKGKQRQNPEKQRKDAPRTVQEPVDELHNQAEIPELPLPTRTSHGDDVSQASGPSSAPSTSERSRPELPVFITAFHRQEAARRAQMTGSQGIASAPPPPPVQAVEQVPAAQAAAAQAPVPPPASVSIVAAAAAAASPAQVERAPQPEVRSQAPVKREEGGSLDRVKLKSEANSTARPSSSSTRGQKVQSEDADHDEERRDLERMEEINIRKRKRKERRRNGTSHSSDEENDDDDDAELDIITRRRLRRAKKKRRQDNIIDLT